MKGDLNGELNFDKVRWLADADTEPVDLPAGLGIPAWNTPKESKHWDSPAIRDGEMRDQRNMTIRGKRLRASAAFASNTPLEGADRVDSYMTKLLEKYRKWKPVFDATAPEPIAEETQAVY